ncbi:MAG: hypothetical protein A3G80_09635 [Betaproteobacteria bacterium RIFCSPLOWO2_12_FULL_62_13b]|nr:MAG: hypothetical protein A3G80_09635 [Betaproteobacteria bacterium RIFCSPLOWO2_12_FULL_62_13b]
MYMGDQKSCRCSLRSSAVLLLGVVALMCFSPLPSSAGQPKVIRVASLIALGHNHSVAIQKFAAGVKQRTQGQIDVQYFPDSQLGSGSEIVQSVKQGTIEMALAYTVLVAPFEPTVGVTMLPYVFRDFPQMRKILHGEPGKKIADRLLQTTGIRTLAWLEQGLRNIQTSRREVLKVEDFRGLKLRVPQAEITTQIYRLLNASPAPMAFGELYTALQTGVMDGAEMDTMGLASSKLYEVSKNLYMWGISSSTGQVIINEKFYQGLTPEQQKILSEEMLAAQKYNSDTIEGLEKKALADLVAAGQLKVVAVPAAELTRVRDILKGVNDAYGKKYKVEDLLKEMAAIQ